MNFEKLSNIPTTALKNITDINSGAEKETISEKDFQQTSEHTTAQNILPENNVTAGSQDSQNSQSNTNQSQGTKLGSVVSGKMAVDLMDVLFPSLVVYVVAMIGYNLPKGRLQLTAKEKEILNPAFQNYLDSINVNFNNPLYNLLFVLGSVYAAKTIDLISSNDIKKSEKSKVEGKKVVEVKPENEWTIEDYTREINLIYKRGKEKSRQYFLDNQDMFKEYDFKTAIEKIKERNMSKPKR